MDANLFMIVAAVLVAQPAWRDPSPHEVRFVPVESSVRLEVLDWGGTGRPIVFVGCYLTADVYDDIAPKLTDQFHVYAVTRRGGDAAEVAGRTWQELVTRALPPSSSLSSASSAW